MPAEEEKSKILRYLYESPDGKSHEEITQFLNLDEEKIDAYLKIMREDGRVAKKENRVYMLGMETRQKMYKQEVGLK